MDYIKQWSFYICSTLIFSSLLSILSPKGNMSKIYKTIISLFIFISLLMPITHIGEINLESFKVSNFFGINENTNSIANNALKSTIQSFLEKNDILGSRINCVTYLNENNEIVVESVQIAISDEYDVEYVRKMVFDSLSVNARVIHIGE